MELQEIEKLIGKYEAGETSLAQEEILREYFASQQVPPHLETLQGPLWLREAGSQGKFNRKTGSGKP